MISVFRGFPRGPGRGAAGDPGIYQPDSAAWRVNGESVLLLGGPRALLMQIAHPSVAAGVADHSDFPHDPFPRLWRTMDAMLTVSFGDRQQSREAADRVNAVHGRVRGGAPGGEPYDALDPELLLWVHATLVDSALAAYERFVGPLGTAHREHYYEEMKRQAVVLRVPAEVLPGSLSQFHAYVARTVARLRVSEQARGLAADIVSPPVPLTLRPVTGLIRLATVGLLPESLRRQYGLPWGPGRERALAASAAAVRTLLPLVPQVLRKWPHARAAERRIREAGGGELRTESASKPLYRKRDR